MPAYVPSRIGRLALLTVAALMASDVPAPARASDAETDEAVAGLLRVGAEFRRDESRPGRPIVWLRVEGSGGAAVPSGPGEAAALEARARDLMQNHATCCERRSSCSHP